MFKVFGLSVAIDKAQILQNISFEIKQGECVALLGENGAGKTTLLNCLLGIIPKLHSAHVTGQLSIDGTPTRQMKISDIGRIVGFLLENPEAQFISLSVAEEVALTLMSHGRNASEKSIRNALEQFGMESFFYRNPKTLSEGEKQRVTLAALCGAKPKAMILDEPTSALDAQGRTLLLEFLKKSEQSGITVLFSTHDLSIAERAAQRGLGLRGGTVKIDRPLPNGRISEDLFPGISEVIAPPPKTVTVKPNVKSAIETTGLSFSYSRLGNMLFRDLSFSLRPADACIIRGRNGSGKTTLLYLLAGLLQPSKGTILISETSPRKIPAESRSKYCGLAFQNPEHQILMHTVDEELVSGVAVSERDDPELMKRLEWIKRVFPIPYGDRDPHTLSLGQKKILTVATAIVPSPSVLLLDEPELGLDPVQRKRVAQAIKMLRQNWGTAMVIVTHDGEIIRSLEDAIVLELNEKRDNGI